MLQIAKTSDAWQPQPLQLATPTRDPFTFAIEPMGDDSMAPRYQHGEQLYAHSLRPAEPGVDVVVYLKDGGRLVRRLAGRDADGSIRVERLNPGVVTRIAAHEIDELLPIVGCSAADVDLLAV